jgi:ribosomal protein S27E
MPMINFKCNKCENQITKMFKKAIDIPSEIACGSCGGILERQLGSPSSKSTQVIDNGFQARRVEIMNDVVEKERDRLYNEEE